MLELLQGLMHENLPWIIGWLLFVLLSVVFTNWIMVQKTTDDTIE